MKELLEQEKIKIGKNIAKLLILKKDTIYRDRYQTLWGTKTALGIYHTFQRIMEDIETDNFKIDE